MNTIKLNDQLVMPSKVVCVGRNYAQHIAELNNEQTGDMVIFIKSNSAISHQLLAFHQEPLHYEGEIAFLVENGQFVAASIGLDLTKRRLQSSLKAKQLPWERAKGFDGAAVFERFVPLPEAVDFVKLSLELFIDGELKQKGGVADMLFKPSVILEDLNSFLSLEDGDIVMTGTPEGVGEVKQGAEFVGRLLLGDEILLESHWLAE
ncbi:MAG: 2-keto-4-pentenoate hydratase/2-oxohepta-3-ene-1,7-dioic acid hydratase in catechol pathway [Kiritimatiellia bacterium]|jgi:2-keto-4-pentenoate hydratase/2-oxohepta-3-ene-1,7-dioic acid hydratase in catechol pathway